MARTRSVEIFSAGCPACAEVVKMVEDLRCASCEVDVRDMRDASVARRAQALGIRRVPALVVDGQLAACCRDMGPTKESLRATGIGQPIS